MRAFVAVEIPESLRERMMAVRDRLLNAGVEATWVRPAGIHLTLKFLGEVREERVPDILEALALAAADKGRLRLGIEGAGTFPNAPSARVVWLGITGETVRLAELQSAIERAMVGLGFASDDRPFCPHLTVGRVKRIRKREIWLRELEGVKDFALPGFDVVSFSLISSELRPGGAVYREVGRLALGGGMGQPPPPLERPERPPQ
jgi:2'-5' RNA ligase